MRLAPSALIAAALCLLPVPASAQERASLPDIEDEVMCPICGTTLELSDSPQAERERALIRRMIAAGRSKEEIKDALVAEYGEAVLAVPESEGFDLAAWLLPIVGLAFGVAGLTIAVARAGGRDARGRPPSELSEEDRRRLEADLASEQP